MPKPDARPSPKPAAAATQPVPHRRARATTVPRATSVDDAAAVALAAVVPAAVRHAVPRRRSKETRPQQLLDAALQLFVERGFAATRTGDVARLAGVSKGTLYLYYPSKEELFKALVRETLTALIAEGQALAASFDGSASDLIVLLMNTWWDRVGATPAAGIHKVVLAEVRNFPDLAQFYNDEVIQPADRLFSGIVARGIASGEFRALPVHEAAQALLAPMIYHALQRHSFGACQVSGLLLDPGAVLRTQLEIMLRGLQSRPARRS